MRGKAHNSAVDEYKTGITPAYAGKRTKQPLKCEGQQDHPRVCGEKTELTVVVNNKSGSPPRVRGKVSLSIPTDSAPGIQCQQLKRY